jgi:hypothetical protein
VEPVVIEDSIDTNNQASIRALYYADCDITDATYYRYYILSDSDDAKTIAQKLDMVIPLIKQAADNLNVSLDYPTGIGPVQVQLFTTTDYTAQYYGLDGNLFWIYTSTANRYKQKSAYIRIAVAAQPDDFWGVGVYDSISGLLNGNGNWEPQYYKYNALTGSCLKTSENNNNCNSYSQTVTFSATTYDYNLKAIFGDGASVSSGNIEIDGYANPTEGYQFVQIFRHH